MRLSELLKEITKIDLSDVEITEIISDSRQEISSGTLFVCVTGKRFDGHNEAAGILEKGAAAVVVERDLGLPRQILVPDTRKALAALCAAFFGHPERKFKLIGVTGTNGKTTITTVLKEILGGFGFTTGLIGTRQNEIGAKILHTERTTPEAYELYGLFSQMADAGCAYVVMEVSSQGLEQERLGPCEFETAVFANLTQDHLDVHGTMEQYYQAKKKLFSMCRNAIVNIDDEYGKRLFSEITCSKRTMSITGEAADFMATDIVTHSAGVEYVFCDGKAHYPVRFGMPGLFNVANSADVLAVLDSLGFDMAHCTAALSQERGVRGRAEILPTGRDFTVICDYAHTPDALENILSALKPTVKGRLVCLFGCGGNRDAKKRPLMAAASAKYADFLIVTSDNPRDEDPDAIIDEVLTGLAGSQVPYVRMTDRIEAIQWAVLHAQKGDVIVLAGKGHEDYQILADGVKIHLDEREEVEKALMLLEKQESTEKKD